MLSFAQPFHMMFINYGVLGGYKAVVSQYQLRPAESRPFVRRFARVSKQEITKCAK